MVDRQPGPKARGGARPGAGRRPGSGRYGESTVPVRIPVSLQASVLRLLRDGTRKLPLIVVGKPSETSMLGA